ncbi:hypothetical protein N7478_003933 [Penicillium angulare]|uniref:uncharacterized protein n=1 Tax=Penicillium angulare TaxID=116970 RepID=UPI0025423BFF|nr:uncharacterized protein N7478_003933 [Penicillium angulare]KAJ5288247.1 hypothetical protein N7478_003933 [Penicillium angulare]
MSQHSKNNGPHDYRAMDIDIQESNVKGDENEPKVPSESQQQRPDAKNNGEQYKDIPANSRFMPQSGKPAGVQYDKQKKRQEERRNDVSASSRFMPQAGKPTGTSSI